MSKYALIQNIGGLTVFVYCVIYFTLKLVDFQAISLNPAYIVYHLILPTINNAKVGSCDAGRTWARP
jgi:hypothetical protein